MELDKTVNLQSKLQGSLSTSGMLMLQDAVFQGTRDSLLGMASLTNGHQSCKQYFDQPGHVDSPFCRCKLSHYIMTDTSQCWFADLGVKYASEPQSEMCL